MALKSNGDVGVGASTVGETSSHDSTRGTWRRRVVERSLSEAAQRSVDRSAELIFAAATLLERSNGDDFTVQEVADTAKQSVRAVYVHFDGKDDLLLAVIEEAMQAYTRVVSEAIAVYEDPLERLAAAVYFSVRLPERATRGISVGMSRLRTKFALTKHEELAHAQAPMTDLFLQLVREAADAGEIHAPKPHAATYMLRTLLADVSASQTLGNQYALDPPDCVELVEFCLRGLNARMRDGWEERFEQRWDALPSNYSVGQDLKIATATSQ